MKVYYNKSSDFLIEIILFTAVFNDIIRMPNTVISGFRLLLPIVLCMAIYNIHLTWKFFLFGYGMIYLLVFQNIVFCRVFKYENTIDLMWQLRYIFYYLSVIAIFILLRLIRKKNITMFKRMFFNIIPRYGVLCLIAYIAAVSHLFKNISFTNWNDYGACLAAIFPLFLIDFCEGKKRNFILCLIIPVALWKGDSKAALAGILIQIIIIGMAMIIKKIKYGKQICFFAIPLLICLCLLVVLSPIKINGYSIKNMFVDMLSRIISGRNYENNSSSLKWRTNTIIYMLKGIKDSYGIGIGIGNTGKLLRQLMPDIVSGQKLGNIAISSHCALLEFFCDCGIWAIILCVYIYVFAIKKLFRIKEMDKIDLFLVSFILSFPIWVMSPSGIYTIYFVFIIIAWLYEWSKISKRKII